MNDSKRKKEEKIALENKKTKVEEKNTSTKPKYEVAQISPQ